MGAPALERPLGDVVRHPLRRLLAAATVAACAAVAFGSVADAQTDAGRFERTEREAGLSIPGGVRSSAWGDADGDGDPDLALIDDDGVLLERLLGAPGHDGQAVLVVGGPIAEVRD